MKKLLILTLMLGLVTKATSFAGGNYKTKNVIILIMDGPRYSETWGDTTHKLIPNMANNMAQHGIINTCFRNEGYTYTCSGHTALCTGVYQNIRNNGTETPHYPSIFQYYLKATGKSRTAAYVIASKDKLSILTNCEKKAWRDQYRPAQDCGNNGLNSGFRSDQKTYESTLEILKKDHPNLVIVNFRQPDAWGHAGNWENFLSTTKQTDEFIYRIFQFLQRDENYKDNTTIFVTNDHGRHLDGRKDGFISHGDGCEGCRHINFFAYGPDFKSNVILDTPRETIDIPVTTAELLGFKLEYSKGKVMTELFKEEK